MQLIRPTSEFEVGHLPFQGKVKGILLRLERQFLAPLSKVRTLYGERSEFCLPHEKKSPARG